ITSKWTTGLPMACSFARGCSPALLPTHSDRELPVNSSRPPLHLLFSGRFRCAVPPSGHGSAPSLVFGSIPLRRPALRARLRSISSLLVDSAAPSRPPGTAPLHLLSSD